MKQTPYETLGLAPDATLEQIRAAYRKASKRHHPDAGGSQEAFAAITEAHEVLSDPDRRAYFDATGSMEQLGGIDEDAHAMVLDLIGQGIEQATERGMGAVPSEFWANVRAVLVQQKNKQERETAKMDRRMALLADTQRKMKAKSPGNVKLGVMVGNFAKSMEEAKSKMVHRSKTLEAALALVDGYEFEGGVAPTVKRYTTLELMEKAFNDRNSTLFGTT